MAWGQQNDNKAPPAGPPGAPVDAPGASGRNAMPPKCPRCEVTKAQFSRTIQNYQKAYRKKVEGLKTELKAVRNTNESLRRQVRSLKSLVRLHLPSLVVGAAVGFVFKTYSGAIKALLARKGRAGDAVQVGGDGNAPAIVDEPSTPPQQTDASGADVADSLTPAQV